MSDKDGERKTVGHPSTGKVDDKFYIATEIVFAIFMLEGFLKVGEPFKWRMLAQVMQHEWNWSILQYFSCAILATAVLIRFFFAPYKNLRWVADGGPDWGTKSEKLYYPLILLFDVPLLLLHAVIYYEMCKNILDCRLFLLAFFILLSINVVWLWLIEFRLWLVGKKDGFKGFKWTKNNIVHIALGFIFVAPWFLFGSEWEFVSKLLLLVLVATNSAWDLCTTYRIYLKD